MIKGIYTTLFYSRWSFHEIWFFWKCLSN